jgi:4-coumarate--CoA ligase
VGIRKVHIVVVALPNLDVYPMISLEIMSVGLIFSDVNPHAIIIEAKLVVINEVAFNKVKDTGIPVISVNDVEFKPDAISWDELLATADHTSMAVVALERAQQFDLCVLPYPSGTTGMSKGVMLSHLSLVSDIYSSMFSVGLELVG